MSDLNALPWMERWRMLPPTGGLILCAVSGGRDSVCLLHYLHHLGQERGFAVAAAFDAGKMESLETNYLADVAEKLDV